ncbi:MAG: BNR-4 repeat-containing protein [Pirellulaceae bacterium]
MEATRNDMDETDSTPVDNFSYLQVWNRPGSGFSAFFTHYHDPAERTICFMRSGDGKTWSHWQRLAAIESGSYQVSAANSQKLATFFNFHPKEQGLNWRTNLYYMESPDGGNTWQNIHGETLEVPLTEIDNVALAVEMQSKDELAYLKDLKFDSNGNPVMLYVASHDYHSGPQDPPRSWRITCWNGKTWVTNSICPTDSNYDSGELWLKSKDQWLLLAPTTPGPQQFNPGGEVCIWESNDQGATWRQIRKLTEGSEMNHSYVRTVLNAHPDMVAIWADGNAREPSHSRLYFADSDGDVYQMPQQFPNDHDVFVAPIPHPPGSSNQESSK